MKQHHFSRYFYFWHHFWSILFPFWKERKKKCHRIEIVFSFYDIHSRSKCFLFETSHYIMYVAIHLLLNSTHFICTYVHIIVYLHLCSVDLNALFLSGMIFMILFFTLHSSMKILEHIPSEFYISTVSWHGHFKTEQTTCKHSHPNRLAIQNQGSTILVRTMKNKKILEQAENLN